jgi:hypothetical protein
MTVLSNDLDNLGRPWLSVDMLAVGVSSKRLFGVDGLRNMFVTKCLGCMERVNGIEPSWPFPYALS